MRVIKNAIKLGAAILTVLVLAAQVPAAAASGVTAQIPLSQKFLSNRPKADDRFTYILEAVTSGAPMPEGSKNGTYQFTMEGTENTTLGIASSEAGRVEYKLYQLIKKEQRWYSYDKEVYSLSLTFYKNNENKLEAAVLIENSKGEKAEAAHFFNQYQRQVTPSQGGPNANTGDTSHVYTYCAIMAGSAILLCVLMIWMKKQRECEADETE